MKMLGLIVGQLLVTYTSYCDAYSFPENFNFGVGTAAFQVEGAWNVSEKGETIWDRQTHTHPHQIPGRGNNEIASDTYSKTKEDVQLLKYLGVNYYRFSISWARILPNGKTDYINPDGIRYYNELIDELLANGIKPLVTMYHFDLPQALQDEGGFLNMAIVDYFVKYANILYDNFGDRVKNWITFNEPIAICHHGYSTNLFPPKMAAGPITGYVCGYHVLLAHAKAYHLYKRNYKITQAGRVGITNIIFWFEPLSDTIRDREASEIAVEYIFGWFAHPIFSKSGDYPQIMKDTIDKLSIIRGLSSSALPKLTHDEIDLIKGSADFLGISHYTTHFCTEFKNEAASDQFSFSDVNVTCQISETMRVNEFNWIQNIPWGLYRALNWIKNQYNNPEVIITENGYPTEHGQLHDCKRIQYINSYLAELLKAVHEDGCNVSGYTAWSFVDSFELVTGYKHIFGLYSVDFDDPNRPRTPKMSAHIFKNIIETRKLNWDYVPEGFGNCEWSNKNVSLNRKEL